MRRRTEAERAHDVLLTKAERAHDVITAVILLLTSAVGFLFAASGFVR